MVRKQFIVIGSRQFIGQLFFDVVNLKRKEISVWIKRLSCLTFGYLESVSYSNLLVSGLLTITAGIGPREYLNKLEG